LLPLKGGEKRLGVIFPRFSSLDARIMIEEEVLGEKEFLLQEFQKFGISPTIKIVAMEPGEEEIQQALIPGVGMNGGHQPTDNAEPVEDNLGERGQAVGGA